MAGQDLVVQVNGGGIAGAAHLADRLAEAEPPARSDILEKGFEVGIAGIDPMAMVQGDIPAEAAAPAGFPDNARRCGIDHAGRTGDEVEVQRKGDGWTKIRLVAEDKVGWIPDGYLQPEAPPGVRLEIAVTRASELETELEELRTEAEKLRKDNGILSGQDGQQQAKIKELTLQNMKLRAGARYPEWITGAAIFAAGMILGAILHRNSTRHKPTRIRL